MDRTAELITLTRALRLGKAETVQYHRQHLNPRLAELCEIIEADTPLVRAHGTYIWDAEGNEFLDFVSGFAALNLGHNHPRVLEALELANDSVNLIEGLGTLPAALAHNLSALAPGSLGRICFLNSGAEAVDASIKLARAATKRTKLVACQGSFHGRSVGALSVSHRREFREPFEPLLPVTFIPYGDSNALDAALRRHDAAGFIVEPIQGEGGIVIPPSGFLSDARDLCTRSGTVFIVDEIQTGLGRTGQLFAVNHEQVAPDVLLLGKALGGGVMPISSVLSTEALWKAAGGGTPRSPFTFPTFGAVLARAPPAWQPSRRFSPTAWQSALRA
jgi:putrescine aminotransferase